MFCTQLFIAFSRQDSGGYLVFVQTLACFRQLEQCYYYVEFDFNKSTLSSLFITFFVTKKKMSRVKYCDEQ